MTELERREKAYARLAGRVDTVISKLKESEIMADLANPALRLAADSLTKALLEAGEIIVAEGGIRRKKRRRPHTADTSFFGA